MNQTTNLFDSGFDSGGVAFTDADFEAWLDECFAMPQPTTVPLQPWFVRRAFRIPSEVTWTQSTPKGLIIYTRFAMYRVCRTGRVRKIKECSR